MEKKMNQTKRKRIKEKSDNQTEKKRIRQRKTNAGTEQGNRVWQ